MEKESIILLASVISALATIVLAYLTWKYVKLPHEMVDEIKKSRNPLVLIDFIEKMKGDSITKIDIIISNKGLSSAKDINLNAVYDTSICQNELIKGKVKTNRIKLSELPFFRNGISYLAPGNDIYSGILNFNNVDIHETPLVKIMYNYNTDSNETIYNNIMLDLRYSPKEEM